MPHATPKVVQTTLNYYLEPDKGGSDHRFVGTAGYLHTKHVPVATEITDIRGIEDDFSLDKQGFQFVRCETREKTFDDEKRIKTVYYEDCEQLIKKATGASRLINLSHVMRKTNFEATIAATKDVDGTEPVAPTNAPWVHVDNAPQGAELIFKQVAPDEWEKVSKTRWAIINLWRPIVKIDRDPLALCDARSVLDTDLRSVELRFVQKGTDKTNERLNHFYKGAKNFDMFGLVPPKTPGKHKWYYASDMTPDEALLIKIYDNSKKDGVAWRTPHSSFSTPDDSGPPRQSLEYRCFAIWEDDKDIYEGIRYP